MVGLSSSQVQENNHPSPLLISISQAPLSQTYLPLMLLTQTLLQSACHLLESHICSINLLLPFPLTLTIPCHLPCQLCSKIPLYKELPLGGPTIYVRAS